MASVQDLEPHFQCHYLNILQKMFESVIKVVVADDYFDHVEDWILLDLKNSLLLELFPMLIAMHLIHDLVWVFPEDLYLQMMTGLVVLHYYLHRRPNY